MSDRFICRYRGPGKMPRSDLERVRHASGIGIVDQTPRMLLIDGEAERVEELAQSLPDWIVVPETPVQLPDVRQRIRSTRQKSEPAEMPFSTAQADDSPEVAELLPALGEDELEDPP